MSTITALVHHIDQLLTQHGALRQEHTQLQSRVTELEQQLVKQQQHTNSLTSDADLESDRAQNQTLEDELNYLISLFDQATETKHD
jgi:hypothetical protein|tara:strand:- start:380 stop:637 length:258 start_codon:yes stop_codon:yes gene_type:complete